MTLCSSAGLNTYDSVFYPVLHRTCVCGGVIPYQRGVALGFLEAERNTIVNIFKPLLEHLENKLVHKMDSTTDLVQRWSHQLPFLTIFVALELLALAILLTALMILCGMVRGEALLAPAVNLKHPHGLAIIVFTV